MKTILFICQANVGRSQMAEAFYNLHTQSHTATSAGVEDYREKYNYHPTSEIVQTMQAIGIDITKQRIKVITPEMCDSAEKIIVLCDKEFCPDFLLQNSKVKFHKIEDPHEQTSEAISKIRDEIEQLVLHVIEEKK